VREIAKIAPKIATYVIIDFRTLLAAPGCIAFTWVGGGGV
jgi:hypothetical protein